MSFNSTSHSCIYLITNLVNGKQYIGRAAHYAHRIASHKSALNLNCHANKHLQAAWNKYGAESFAFTILEECPVEQLSEREIYWISELDTYRNGYNRTIGGEGVVGIQVSDETRKQMSERMKGNKHLLGHKHTEEARKKVSDALRKRPKELIEKIANSCRGKKRSDECKKKISEANRRRKLSEASKEKMRQSALGRTASPETKAKMSEVVRQRWDDPKFREKITDSSKNNWEAEKYRKRGLAQLNQAAKTSGKKRRTLTLEQAQEIRRRYKWRSPDNNAAALAKEFGVSRGVIRDILANRTYLD